MTIRNIISFDNALSNKYTDSRKREKSLYFQSFHMHIWPEFKALFFWLSCLLPNYLVKQRKNIVSWHVHNIIKMENKQNCEKMKKMNTPWNGLSKKTHFPPNFSSIHGDVVQINIWNIWRYLMLLW